MAREEAAAVAAGCKFINKELLEKVPHRSLDAIKGARRGQQYKSLVTAALSELRDKISTETPSVDHAPPPCPPGLCSALPAGTGFAPVGGPPSEEADAFVSQIRLLIPEVERVEGWHSDACVIFARRFLDGFNPQDLIEEWTRAVFPPALLGRRRAAGRGLPIHEPVSSKARKRLAYARVQRAIRVNMAAAARKILDGTDENVEVPGVEQMAQHWGPFVSKESTPAPQIPPTSVDPGLECVWRPVARCEVERSSLPLNAAAGLDGVTVRLWRAVPPSIKALLYNVVLASGGFPPSLLASRTVFVPKTGAHNTPGDYRPISITSVIVRHLHKILAARIRASNIIDWRQRCFGDGCNDNVAILATLLQHSRRRLRECHIASLDVAKAYDSVSHGAIAAVLRSSGLPHNLARYVNRLYANSVTHFEVCGERSGPYRVNRGVRQGDPLSSVLFALVVDRIIGSIPAEIGYHIGGESLGAIAYADDILLFASTRWGLQTALDAAEREAGAMGLVFNPTKCSVLSLVPSGKEKKIKILTAPGFHIDKGGSVLPQVGPKDMWKYLGVEMSPMGPRRVGSELATYLNRLTRAPLKPQQRMKILRAFLVPRLYHTLVLGAVTLGKLRVLDRQIRASVRRWLRLPGDVPMAFVHASIQEGGLGIPSLSTTIPGLIIHRLEALQQSAAPQIRAVSSEEWVQRRLRWARNALTVDGQCLSQKEQRDRWWARRLHSSVDGCELRECSRTSCVSSWWVDGGSLAVPGRDYVQYVHVRVNCLPTRIRTSRGVRRDTYPTGCRAGCGVTETAAHVIQGCHRTHGGRVRRHNAVAKTLAAGLRDKGWTVQEEPVFVTAEGRRKPDLVCRRGGSASVIDVQIVSGATSLDEAHERKAGYYKNNPSLVEALSRSLNVEKDSIDFSSSTISWRGIWSLRSVDHLSSMGVSRGLLRGITTRVLQGSHMNWTRWNRITTVRRVPANDERRGVG